MNSATNPIKTWLSGFLFVREHYSGPTGQPLYQYQVQAAEYAELRDLLRQHRDLRDHFLHGPSWDSTFCLYVAERFRREYDGSEEGWSWFPIERALDCSFTLQGRAAVVERGLNYWKRPVRQQDDRRHLLGSLFLEGGLPWPLVQNDRHGFGRAVRRGLKYNYRTEGGRISTADLIADVEESLPKTFRNLDTRHLLAGVVEQLMTLVKRYPLTDVEDPAAYLDSRDKRWREAFPIPLDEGNARTLINDWLRDADKSNRERAEALARERNFACAHRLIGDLKDWRILTEVTLPMEEMLPVNVATLRGTRLTLSFHEGESMVQQARGAYGRIQSEKLVVPYAVPTVGLERCNLAEPISLRVSESGRVIHTHTFDGSQLDIAETPLVFENRADQWWLAATASCRLVSEVVRVRLPPGAALESGAVRELGADAMGGRWIETAEDLVVRAGDDLYRLRLRGERDQLAQPQLKGDLSSYESTPATVYLGKPVLDIPPDAGYSRADLIEFEDGRPASAMTRTGAVRYTVCARSGETVLVRRFGMLPKGFRVRSYPATDRQLACLMLRNAQHLECRVATDGVLASIHATDDGLKIELSCGTEPPLLVSLELCTQGQRDPVTIKVPYPLVGARLVDGDNKVSLVRELTTDELLGVGLTLLSSRPQDFYLVFKLQASGLNHQSIQRHYRVKLIDEPVSVGLFAYLQDIRQMLGCVPEQHASVRLQVETDQEWRRLDIGRYSGYLDQAGAEGLIIRDGGGRKISGDAEVEAMSIVDPGRHPIVVPERMSEGVGSGVFVPPPELETNGPWILYPAKRSRLRFAPKLYHGRDAVDTHSGNASTLQEAVRLYHPIDNPLIVDEHVAAMSTDLDSGGWEYLHQLRRRFDHLPLSTFATWLSLARQQATLAVALLRLELDAETCGRMRDELAVLWESIPLQTWINAFGLSRTWLQAQGLAGEYVQGFLTQRATVLYSLVPAYAHLGDLLVTGKWGQLPSIPLQHLLSNDYAKLRRDHSDDDHWPLDLGQELAEWVSRQADLPLEIRNLANVEYAHAVTYLPMFMAFVTMGRASIDELKGESAYIKFVIRKLSEFDWSGWYLPVHAAVLFYLLSLDDRRNR